MTTTTISPTSILAQPAVTEASHPLAMPQTMPQAMEMQGASSANMVLDGLANIQTLKIVLKRVLLASTVYATGSSMFIYTLLQAIHLYLFDWGPLRVAEENIFFVIYFTGIMLPFALILAWCYRYNQALPYQQRVIELDLPYNEAYELSLAAMLSLPGAELISADEKSGEILGRAPKRKNAAPQELKVELLAVRPGKSQLTIKSQARLNAVEYLLFGFTLAVDGGRNKSNVDEIVSFLRVVSSSERLALYSA